ncbi:MAG: hypothetical protein ABIY52_13755 [Gemmatimonadaceae bacterium]
MQPAVESPTPRALADLVARCDQINRFETQLTAAEDVRVAALASGLLVMRQVLTLEAVPSDKLPGLQSRISHWLLSGDHLEEAHTPAVRQLTGRLALDEHEQVKILGDRSWRGQWRTVTLWRNGIMGISNAAMMEYLASLTAFAQRRAPDVARSLLARSEALESSDSLLAGGPRGRTSGPSVVPSGARNLHP